MKENKSRIITGSSSIFLDSLRIVAALTVLFVHAHDQWFPSQETPASPFGKTAHAAVVVFFVLSGYVIAHTTTNNNRGMLQYFQARFTRLWSIVLPALLITALIEFFVIHVDLALMIKYSRGLSLPRYVMSGFFLNEIWIFSSAPPINVPLWSLGYEFWYYVIFGLWFYRKLGWLFCLPAIIACFFVGPNILLMFPIWLAGNFVYNLSRPIMKQWHAWAYIFIALILFCITIVLIPLTPNAVGPKPLFWAGQFFSDWVACVFIAFTLWLLPTGKAFKMPSKWAVLYRKFADLTFPIYVLHYPLLVLFHALLNFKPNNALQFSEVTISVLFISTATAILMEKQHIHFSAFFKLLLNNINIRWQKISLKYFSAYLFTIIYFLFLFKTF